jgi:hypothetical protein
MFIPDQYLPNQRDLFPPLDRRRLRAEYLIEHGRTPWTRDDPVTWEVWAFLRERARCEGDAEQTRLERRFPAVAEAFRVFTGADRLRRWELEARLLTGDPDEVIAARMGLSPAGVAAYHDLYFDVRPHLRYVGYVTAVAIGRKAYHGLQPEDHDILLKLYGYGLGGYGVDSILNYLSSPFVIPEALETLDLPALKELQRKLMTHLVVLAMTTPATALAPLTWIRLSGSSASFRYQGNDDQPAVLGKVRAMLEVATCFATGKLPAGMSVEGPTPERVPA